MVEALQSSNVSRTLSFHDLAVCLEPDEYRVPLLAVYRGPAPAQAGYSASHSRRTAPSVARSPRPRWKRTQWRLAASRGRGWPPHVPGPAGWRGERPGQQGTCLPPVPYTGPRRGY